MVAVFAVFDDPRPARVAKTRARKPQVPDLHHGGLDGSLVTINYGALTRLVAAVPRLDSRMSFWKYSGSLATVPCTFALCFFKGKNANPTDHQRWSMPHRARNALDMPNETGLKNRGNGGGHGLVCLILSLMVVVSYNQFFMRCEENTIVPSPSFPFRLIAPPPPAIPGNHTPDGRHV